MVGEIKYIITCSCISAGNILCTEEYDDLATAEHWYKLILANSDFTCVQKNWDNERMAAMTKPTLQAHMLQIKIRKCFDTEWWLGELMDTNGKTVWVSAKQSAQEAFTACLERLNKAVEVSGGNVNG